MYSRKKFEALRYDNVLLGLEKKISDTELMILKTHIFKDVLKEPFPQVQSPELPDEENEGETEGDGEKKKVVEKVVEKKIVDVVENPLVQKNSELRVIIKSLIKIMYHYLDERVNSQENELLQEEIEVSNELLEKYESEVKRLTHLYNHEKQIKIFRGNLKEKMTEKMASLLKENQQLQEFKVKYEERIQEEFEAKQTIFRNQVLQRDNDYYKIQSSSYMKALDRLGSIYSINGVIHGKLLVKKWKQMFKKIAKERKPVDDEEQNGICTVYNLLFLWNVVYHNVTPEIFNERILKNKMLNAALGDYSKTVERVFDKFKEGKEKLVHDSDLTNLTMRLKLLFPPDLYPESKKEIRYCGHSLLYLVRSIILKHEVITARYLKKLKLQKEEQEEEEEGENNLKKKEEGDIEFLSEKIPDPIKNVMALFKSELSDYVLEKKLGSYCLRNLPEISTVLVAYHIFLNEPKRKDSEWQEMEKQLFRCLYYMKNRIAEQVAISKKQNSEIFGSENQGSPDKDDYYKELKKHYDHMLEENKNYIESKKNLAKLKTAFEKLKKENGKIELSKKQLQSDFRVFQYTHDSKIKKAKTKIEDLEGKLKKWKNDNEKNDEDREKEQIVLKAQIQKLEGQVVKMKEMEDKIVVLEKKVRNPTLNPEQLQALQMNTTIYTNLLRRFHYVYLMNLNEKKKRFILESDLNSRMDGGVSSFEKIKKTFQIRRELSEIKKNINFNVLGMNIVDLTDIKKGEEESEGENEEEEIEEDVRKRLERLRIKDIIENEYPRKVIELEDKISKLKKEKINKLKNQFASLSLGGS